MTRCILAVGILVAAGMAGTWAAPDDALFPDVVTLPAAGRMDARALTPDLLEVRAVAGRTSWEEPPSTWAELERPDLSIAEPEPDEFRVEVGGRTVEVQRVGFRRMPIFADYHSFDLRILNQLFLELAEPLAEGDRVRIVDRAGRLWARDAPMEVDFTEDRFSPAIHVNDAGYAPAFPKIASVSDDLGTLGELGLPGEAVGRVRNELGEVVFSGPLVTRPDEAWDWHQRVWRFDFSEVREPGLYRIEVPGLGRSAVVRIHDGAFAAAARLHALGTLHQRSGFAKVLPFTRYEHAASHVRPAEIPTMDARFDETNDHIGDMARKNTEDDQVAPRFEDVSKSLAPFVREGSVDVSGGHYDAGDYSKYVVNSSALVAALVFAVDNFPGVDAINNLGLPESGDGVPDALQIAKWEADFLLKMQDEDGGFYFLVYPRDRPYELDVLPEDGDPQVVFPKTTISTGAAVGALAQCAASPVVRRFFPAEAKAYLGAAERGYAFLKRLIDEHGLDGAYQALSHYGTFDGHRDELCFAAAALFAATGEKRYEDDLRGWWPDPRSDQSSRWGWWPLFEAYGSAARVYAFAEQNGTLPAGTADAGYLAAMRDAVGAGGDAMLKLADANAFGIPLSLSSKRRAQVGWYWAMDFAFDLAAATRVTDDAARRERLIAAVLDGFNYEFGANPANRAFVSGAGTLWRQQVVNRITLNDRRTLAVPGVSSGNVFSSPHNLRPYQIDGASGLRRMFHPSLDEFAFYERAATDAYNVRAEGVTAITARILATYLFLMAQTDTAGTPWASPAVQIVGVPERVRVGEEFTATLELPAGLSLDDAEVVWELPDAEPVVGAVFRGTVRDATQDRLEAEVVWPDGRRAFAVRHLVIGEEGG